MQDEIIKILESIDASILNTQNISLEQIKLLILIFYNDCLAKDPDPVIKSFLTVVCKHYIDLENEYQEANKFKNEDMDLIAESVLVEKTLNEVTAME